MPTKTKPTTFMDIHGVTRRTAPVYTTRCDECGMGLYDGSEFHPYAACLMYEGCRDTEKVRANLYAVYEWGRQGVEGQ